MEATKRKKFICKFCKKRYPCGKSLGGHIRIHLNGHVNSEAAKLSEAKSFVIISNNNGGLSKRESEGETGGQSGYGLRENPKKTKRFSLDSNDTNLLQQEVCRECGKGFQSLKALCGHMACHSKNSSLEDHYYSGTSEKLKEAIMDEQLDTETSAPSKGSKGVGSKINRYNGIVGACSSTSLSLTNSDVEQEQEEVALSLMMLSRDSSFKGCFSFIADSSDDNSVVLESKLRISVKNGGNTVFDGEEILEMQKSKEREQLVAFENDQSDNSDSGYFRNGPKNVESNVSLRGFTGSCVFKKHKVEFESSLGQDFDPELGKRLSSFRRTKAQLRRNSIEEDGDDQVDRASTKYEPKSVQNESCIPELRSSRAQKRGGKYFALEVDRTSHKKTTESCSDLVYESGEDSIDNDYIPSPLPMPSSNKKIQSCIRKTAVEQKSPGNTVKKLLTKRGNKIYKCPFCSKVFQSGQALGGHKRSHFVGVGRDKAMVINQHVPAEIPIPALIDLNLPAPMEEEEEANNGYMPL